MLSRLQLLSTIFAIQTSLNYHSTMQDLPLSIIISSFQLSFIFSGKKNSSSVQKEWLHSKLSVNTSWIYKGSWLFEFTCWKVFDINRIEKSTGPTSAAKFSTRWVGLGFITCLSYKCCERILTGVIGSLDKFIICLSYIITVGCFYFQRKCSKEHVLGDVVYRCYVWH